MKILCEKIHDLNDKYGSSQSSDVQILMLDPSEHFRPENKDVENFRIYDSDSNDKIQKRVRETYRLMHENQTVDFVNGRIKHWTKFNHTELTIMDALEKLNGLVDESDPDVDLPNIVHAFQTAERIRQIHPDLEWFHLTGLIHDLGKIMAFYDEPQWAVVGDTFPVGCAYGDSIVYKNSFKDNPDLHNPRYNTKCGIYKEYCGLDNLTMSWGHDEYMYRVLKNHKNCTLPDEALYIIRFHSFYPWHRGGDYQHLCSKKDHSLLKWVNEFNHFDLYTKSSDVPDINELIPYYQSLIDKFIPGLVKF